MFGVHLVDIFMTLCKLTNIKMFGHYSAICFSFIPSCKLEEAHIQTTIVVCQKVMYVLNLKYSP